MTKLSNNMALSFETLMERAKRVIDIEAKAVESLKYSLDQNFFKAVELVLNTQNRVVVIGIGKSGHIGNKIAATLASTGTPSFFIHPAEASHGDLGMIMPNDIVIALSNSGETDEILAIISAIKRQNVPLISLTSNAQSTLAKVSDVHININVTEEACPLGLAPTASTTATLAMGDALAITLLEARGFTSEDFAKSHPGGKLGRRLLLKVKDIMTDFNLIPVVTQDTLLTDVLLRMTQKPVGIAIAVDDQKSVLGVFTEGDLRRTLTNQIDIRQLTMKDCMTKKCTVINVDALAIEAIEIMEMKKITALPVINDNCLVGVIHMHHLLKARVI